MSNPDQRDPTIWQKQLLLPLLIGAICRNWKLLQQPLPASYQMEVKESDL